LARGLELKLALDVFVCILIELLLM